MKETVWLFVWVLLRDFVGGDSLWPRIFMEGSLSTTHFCGGSDLMQMYGQFETFLKVDKKTARYLGWSYFDPSNRGEHLKKLRSDLEGSLLNWYSNLSRCLIGD